MNLPYAQMRHTARLSPKWVTSTGCCVWKSKMKKCKSFFFLPSRSWFHATEQYRFNWVVPPEEQSIRRRTKKKKKKELLLVLFLSVLWWLKEDIQRQHGKSLVPVYMGLLGKKSAYCYMPLNLINIFVS